MTSRSRESFSAVRSWVLPGKGCETHARLPVKVQATWRLTPVVWCLPEYSSGYWRQDQQGRRVPSKVQLLGRVGVFHGGNPNMENFGDEWGVGVDNAC